MDSTALLTVLISGNGTNLQALIDKIGTGELPARIVRVISNRKEAFGLERARQAGIPILYHNLLKYKTKNSFENEGIQAAREEYDADLAKLVLQDSPDIVVCLGFLHILSRSFLDPIESAHVKTLNLHPALPGTFRGANAIERAHAAWKEGKINKTGVMIHKLIEEVDMGTPILVQEISFIEGVDDDLLAFKQRVHEVEWKAVVEGTKMVIKELWDERSTTMLSTQATEQASGTKSKDDPE